MGEIGYQAAPILSWAQLVPGEEETTPELCWPRSVQTFSQMRRQDPQIQSVLRALWLPIQRARWYIDGTGCRPEVAEHIAADLGLPLKGAEEKRPLRTKGRFSWRDHLRLALLQDVYGHAFFEQVLELDDRGLLHLRKLAYRPPKTIDKIEVAPDGGLVAIEQKGLIGERSRARIPVDRLVAYINEREGANWAGTSMIRTSYKPWILKDRAMRVQDQVITRNGLGLPSYTAPESPDGLLGEKKIAADRAALKAGLDLVREVRAGDHAGVSLPNGAKFELLGVTGKLPDIEKPIRYFDEQIARSVLAHFLNLGTQTGSWALGSTFADFFILSLQAHAEHILDVTQQHVIEDLVDLNWGPSEPCPLLVCEDVGAPATTVDAFRSLVEAGAVDPTHPAVREWVSANYGVPFTEFVPDAGPDQKENQP